eukprot:scaffold116872_cov63-Phaeocystis_antarctica.AAC.2
MAGAAPSSDDEPSDDGDGNEMPEWVRRMHRTAHRMCTACAPHVHGTLHGPVHCMCTARALHAHCMRTACAPGAECDGGRERSHRCRRATRHRGTALALRGHQAATRHRCGGGQGEGGYIPGEGGGLLLAACQGVERHGRRGGGRGRRRGGGAAAGQGGGADPGARLGRGGGGGGADGGGEPRRAGAHTHRMRAACAPDTHATQAKRLTTPNPKTGPQPAPEPTPTPWTGERAREAAGRGGGTGGGGGGGAG